MRLVIDAMIVVMLLALVGGVVWFVYQRRQDSARLNQTVRALEMLQDEVALQTALALPEAEDAQSTYPAEIDAAWFGAGKPINALAEPFHPWMGVAEQGDNSEHPADPVLDRSGQAMFWYNPTKGIVRARVPRQTTDERTLALYNRVNRTALAKLPAADSENEPAPANEHESLRQAEAEGGDERPADRPAQRSRLDREVMQEVTQVEPAIAEPGFEQWQLVEPQPKEPAPPPRRGPSLRGRE